MRVSVILCTWNRCELLRNTLDSLRSLTVPAGQPWELLVVDNDSSDATRDVIAAFRDHLPLHALFEPQPGLSRARNAAVRAAQGDLVLFTDDDVRVDPSWLSAYVEAAGEWPDAGYFAGPIHPDFAADVPRWVRRNPRALAGMLCLRDEGSVRRRLGRAERPYGPNMAVRRDVLALASFDERVGRRGDENLRGSETGFFQSLRRDVFGVWVPQAEVHHYVPRCRADSAYLWRFYHGLGRTEVRLTMVCGVQSRWQLLRAALKTLGGSCRRPLTWPRHLASVAWMSGLFSEIGRLTVRREVGAADETGR
jgi:glycosyltransferase involved in cell wall biosynthesis